MKKVVSYFTMICILAVLLISCGNQNEPITVNHSIDKTPFALSLKGQLDEHSIELSQKIKKYMDLKKNYFVKIKSHKQLLSIIDKSSMDRDLYHDEFVKSKLLTLGNDFFKKNRLIIVFSFGNIGTYLQVKNIQNNKNMLTTYRIPKYGSVSDVSVGMDCYVIGVSSEYAKAITDVILTYIEEESD